MQLQDGWIFITVKMKTLEGHPTGGEHLIFVLSPVSFKMMGCIYQ